MNDFCFFNAYWSRAFLRSAYLGNLPTDDALRAHLYDLALGAIYAAYDP